MPALGIALLKIGPREALSFDGFLDDGVGETVYDLNALAVFAVWDQATKTAGAEFKAYGGCNVREPMGINQ